MIASDGAPTLAGSITWNPCPPAGAPSPWIETATAACASLPIAARLSTQGPTLVLSVRVMTSFAPAARSSVASRFATSNVNAASEYPELVEVPVVSHAFVPVPIGTGWLMISGWAPLPPLCPASMTIVFPDTAFRSSGPLGGGGAGVTEPDGDGPAEPGEAGPDGATPPPETGAAPFPTGGGPAPQPPPPRTTTARRAAGRTRADTRLMLLAGRREYDFRAGPTVPLGDDRQHLPGRIEDRVRHRDPHRRQRPAMSEHTRLIGRRVPAREEPGRRLGQRQRHRIPPGGPLVQP